MRKAEISFDLTENQMRLLQPLFDKAEIVYNNRKPGMVILQAWESGIVDAGFVDCKNAAKITEVIEKKQRVREINLEKEITKLF